TDYKKFLIKPNDILIAMTGATIGKTSVFKASKKALLNQRVGIIRANADYDERFLAYLINSSVFKAQVIFLGDGGAQENIGTTDIGNINLSIPNNAIQNKISRFLDMKITQVETLIKEKERLIELLEEKRQAIITETVTKGLDPNVNMKDSGIEWIGEIHEHWEVVKIKYLFDIKNGGTPKSNEPDYWDDNGIVWITPEDLSLKGYEISDSRRKISYEGLNNSSATLISEYSIVISTRAPIGNIKYATKKFTTNQGCKSLQKSNVDINELYYFYLLKEFKNELQSLGQGTTFLELSNRSLANFNVPVLPLKEMNELVSRITDINKMIDDLIESQKDTINKLKEYRESLIYEAVTGKIDLRDYEGDTSGH